MYTSAQGSPRGRRRVRVTFGEFVFDTDDRELRKGKKRLDVSPRALQLLAVLLQARPRVITKLELMKEMRSAGPISEARVSALVAELRGALGENPVKPRFIKTVRGYGYAFDDGAETPTIPPRGRSSRPVLLTWRGGEATLKPGVYVLGRGSKADVRVESGTVSRSHAKLTLGRGVARLEDLGSSNGTFVRGEEIEGPAALKDGDTFALGSMRITLKVLPSDRSSRGKA
jgi:DNA-binding winged helix-turn-helix (wHTH) protein